MFYLSADKSKLNVLEKGIITSGSVNVNEVQFRFSPEWDGMERVAVFRVGAELVSVVLDAENKCKVPWECSRENDIGKEILAGVYGMVGTDIVLPTVWASLGIIKEGVRLGDSALPPTPSAAEQILAAVIAAKDAAEAAAKRAEEAAGITGGDGSGDTDTGDGTDDTEGTVPDGDIATDEEVNDTLDDIFGSK